MDRHNTIEVAMPGAITRAPAWQIEGPKTAIRREANGSRKNFFRNFSIIVSNSPPNTRSNQHDVLDPNEWVDIL
jgi:hypothetical protein